MKWSVLGLIVMGLVAAVSASMLVGAFLSPEKAVATHSEEINVLVAAADLDPWTKIAVKDIETKTIKRSEAPESYFTSSTQVLGRTLSRRMVAGQPFGTDTILRGRRPEEDIPEGHRLMTLSLSAHASLKGLLQVGSFVDVLASFNRMHRSEPETKTLMTNVQVFAIEEMTISTSPDEKQPSQRSSRLRRDHMVTLTVTPDQAQILQSTMGSGDIALVLRKPGDKDLIEEGQEEVEIAEVQEEGGPKAKTTPGRAHAGNLLADLSKGLSKTLADWPRALKAKRPVWTVELCRGNETTIVSFPNWSNKVKP